MSWPEATHRLEPMSHVTDLAHVSADGAPVEHERSFANGSLLPPLFRWPGGKRWLVQRLMELVPARTGGYFEPFFGGGAVFFALQPPRSFISDSNSGLMDAYSAIRDDHVRLSKILSAMKRDQAAYYRVRESAPTDRFEQAARFIYLTTLAFNGIHRVNRLGAFNVPYGGRTYDSLGSVETLAAYARALETADISSRDFEAAVASARHGDFVYLDPPYTVAHANNGFVKYNGKIFSWSDQERLAAVAGELSGRGCRVVVSNAHHPSIAALYPSFLHLTADRTSAMAANSVRRGIVQEYILTNVPELKEPPVVDAT
jgi:DNA adenine methylase